jgi:hypothetical protein
MSLGSLGIIRVPHGGAIREDFADIEPDLKTQIKINFPWQSTGSLLVFYNFIIQKVIEIL